MAAGTGAPASPAPGSSPSSQRPYCLWSDAEGSLRIEYSRAVLEEIRGAAARGLMRFGHGGIEIGGLLFGTRLGEFLRILSWEPIVCSHAQGPAFVLSAEDQAALASQIEKASQRDELLLGWFVSHTRSGIDVRPEEHEIAARYFREPWHILLLIRPHRMGDATGCLHRRSEDGSSWRLRKPELEIHPAAIRRRSGKGVVVEMPAAGEPHVPAAPKKKRRANPWAGRILAAALACGLAGTSWAVYYSWQQLNSEQTAPLHLPELRVTGGRDDLRVRWNARSDYVVRAAEARLEFLQDGATTSVPLDRSQLRMGEYRLISPARAGSVTLMLIHAQSAPITETVRWNLGK